MKSLDKVILFGGGGRGKSFSLATALDCLSSNGQMVITMTERNAMSGLERGLTHYGIVPEEGQLIYAFPKKKEKAFRNLNRAIGDFASQSISAAKAGVKGDSNQNKDKYRYFQDILNGFEKFNGIDYVTGNPIAIGHVGDLTAEDIFVIDGMSVLSSELWNVMVGDKVAISNTDYMPVQRVMLDLMQDLQTLECNVIMLAHEKPVYRDSVVGNKVEKVLDRYVVQTGVGEANYEQIIGCFTDVIHANMGANKYVWDVKNPLYDTRIRKPSIPLERTVEPSFSKWGFFGKQDKGGSNM